MFTPYCAICKSGHFLTDPHKWPEPTPKPIPVETPAPDPYMYWRLMPSVWKFEGNSGEGV